MASKVLRDYSILELDPTQEILGHTVVRRKDRRLREYVASQVTFFQTIHFLIECLVPTCPGHQKFGVYLTENVALIYRHHNIGEEAIYVPFKNMICKPLKVPYDGEVLLTGIRWRLTSLNTIEVPSQSIFDCLLACLRFLMITKYFCLECLFRHSNGVGLALERFIKTVLYHIVPYGRYVEKDPFHPINYFHLGMCFKFRRLFWESKNNMFQHSCSVTRDGFRETSSCRILDTSVQGYEPSSRTIPHSISFNPDLFLLRNFNSISTIHVSLKCDCHEGRSIPSQAYVGLLRQKKKCDIYSIVLARWILNGSEYEDPLLNFSLFGPPGPSKMVGQVGIAPLASNCPRCKSQIVLKDIYVPPTTWLFMAEIANPLWRISVDGFTNISTYVLAGTTFELKFVLLYNYSTGNFTSLHFHESNWYFFDESAGGLFKRCNPDRVKYKERINVRAFYIRKTDFAPHRCLLDAVVRLQTPPTPPCFYT